jgi:hypothetical protein
VKIGDRCCIECVRSCVRMLTQHKWPLAPILTPVRDGSSFGPMSGSGHSRPSHLTPVSAYVRYASDSGNIGKPALLSRPSPDGVLVEGVAILEWTAGKSSPVGGPDLARTHQRPALCAMSRLPESGQKRALSDCPLSANSRHCISWPPQTCARLDFCLI